MLDHGRLIGESVELAEIDSGGRGRGWAGCGATRKKATGGFIAIRQSVVVLTGSTESPAIHDCRRTTGSWTRRAVETGFWRS